MPIKDKWFYEIYDKQSLGMEIKELLFHEQSEYQNVLVFESEDYGTVMALDDCFQLSDLDEHMYHKSLTGYGMQNIPADKNELNILVIGAGDGGIVRDLLRNWGERIQKVTMVEIDQMVIDVSKKFFPQIASEFENPKLDLRVADAIQFIDQAADNEFDLVLCDSTDPVGFAAGLIEEDFYKKMQRILKEDGVYVTQSGSPFFQAKELSRIQENLAKVFAEQQTYFGPMLVYPGTFWSYTAASAKILDRSNIDMAAYTPQKFLAKTAAV